MDNTCSRVPSSAPSLDSLSAERLWVSSCASPPPCPWVSGRVRQVFCEHGFEGIPTLALGVVLVLTALLWRGVKSSGKRFRLTTIKVIALVGLPLVAFALSVRAPVEPAAVVGAGALTIGGIVLAMQAVIYSYDGWTGVLYFSGEVKDPARDIPRSMFGGVAAVFIIYMLLAGCFVYVLGIGGVAADTFPAGKVAEAIFGNTGGTIIRIIVIITGLSAVAPIIMMVPVCRMHGGYGLFPRRAAMVTRGDADCNACGERAPRVASSSRARSAR